MPPRRGTSPTVQLLLLSAVWGISFLMIRIAGTAFPPFWIALLRSVLGAALLAVVLHIRGDRLPPLRCLPWLCLVAVTNNVIPFVFFAWGERTVPSSVAAVINATTPLWTLLISMTVHRSRPAAATVAGVLLAFGGVLLVVLSHGKESTVGGPGVSLLGGSIIIGAAALSYAVAAVLAKSKLAGLDPIGLALAQLTLATLILLPLTLGGPAPSALHVAPVAAIAVLGFAGSGIAYLLYYRLLEQVTATQLSAVTYLLPIWGLFWGLLAHETIGMGAYVGVAVTIIGLVLLNAQRPAVAAPLDATKVL